MNRIPRDIKKTLKIQEDCLSKTIDTEKKNQIISKHISHRIKKREEDLLMNKSPEIRIKKEIKELIDSKQSFNNNFGKNNW